MSKVSKFISMSVFRKLQLTQISLSFETSCLQLKNRFWGKKVCVAFFNYFKGEMCARK